MNLEMLPVRSSLMVPPSFLNVEVWSLSAMRPVDRIGTVTSACCVVVLYAWPSWVLKLRSNSPLFSKRAPVAVAILLLAFWAGEGRRLAPGKWTLMFATCGAEPLSTMHQISFDLHGGRLISPRRILSSKAAICSGVTGQAFLP